MGHLRAWWPFSLVAQVNPAHPHKCFLQGNLTGEHVQLHEVDNHSWPSAGLGSCVMRVVKGGSIAIKIKVLTSQYFRTGKGLRQVDPLPPCFLT
jgi:hypothetical protein